MRFGGRVDADTGRLLPRALRSSKHLSADGRRFTQMAVELSRRQGISSATTSNASIGLSSKPSADFTDYADLATRPLRHYQDQAPSRLRASFLKTFIRRWTQINADGGGLVCRRGIVAPRLLPATILLSKNKAHRKNHQSSTESRSARIFLARRRSTASA